MTLEEFILAFRAKQQETKGRCFYCGVQTHKGCKESNAVFQTSDHVVPVSAKDIMSRIEARANCVVCCRKCNNIKEDLTLHEFKRRSGIAEFYAEQILGIRIDNLDDMEAVNAFVSANRKVVGRSIKFNGKVERRYYQQAGLLPEPNR